MMNSISVIGIILIVVGIIALAYQGITYTTKEKVVNIGPLEATAKKEHSIPLSPILGGLSLVVGVILVLAGGRKSAGTIAHRTFD